KRQRGRGGNRTRLTTAQNSSKLAMERQTGQTLGDHRQCDRHERSQDQTMLTAAAQRFRDERKSAERARFPYEASCEIVAPGTIRPTLRRGSFEYANAVTFVTPKISQHRQRGCDGDAGRTRRSELFHERLTIAGDDLIGAEKPQRRRPHGPDWPQ